MVGVVLMIFSATWAAEDRLRHVWVVGPPGVGKSTLLANMICHDMHHGEPVIVIDGRGDLASMCSTASHRTGSTM